MKKVGVLIVGKNNDQKLIKRFMTELIKRSEGSIKLHTRFGMEDLQVDVSELTNEDIDGEISFIINTAQSVINYKKNVKQTIARFKKKTITKINNKNIN